MSCHVMCFSPSSTASVCCAVFELLRSSKGIEHPLEIILLRNLNSLIPWNRILMKASCIRFSVLYSLRMGALPPIYSISAEGMWERRDGTGADLHHEVYSADTNRKEIISLDKICE